MTIPYITGLPGVGSARVAKPSILFRDGTLRCDFSGGRQIDGLLSYDPTNTGDTDSLLPGMLMGKVTSGGLYAPSILGVLSGSYTAGGVTLTVSAAQVTALKARIGSSGTFKIFGPPTGNGTVATETVTFSAASGTSITVTALANNYVAGSFLCPDDGSENAISLLPDGYAYKVTDLDGTTRITVPWWNVPIDGTIKSANITFWPTDTSLQAYIVGMLTTSGLGKFVFDHLY